MLATFALLLATSTIYNRKYCQGCERTIHHFNCSDIRSAGYSILHMDKETCHKIDVTLGHFALVQVRLIHLQESVLSNSLIQITGSK